MEAIGTRSSTQKNRRRERDATIGERSQPPAHVAPDSALHALIYGVRLATDFQFNTIHRHMKKFLVGLSGKVLDVGAGQGPYKHLLDKSTVQYTGLDIHGADDFGYRNPDIVHFDGEHIPFDAETVDSVMCTEVIEHVEDAQSLIDEMHRVLKVGGRGVITVPWAARYHYIPHDFHRFTPARLNNMFSAFSSVSVEPRGTDITVIVSKLVVVYLRLLMPANRLWLPLSFVAAVAFAPALLLAILIGHGSVYLGIGSTDDPLGYTVWLRK